MQIFALFCFKKLILGLFVDFYCRYIFAITAVRKICCVLFTYLLYNAETLLQTFRSKQDILVSRACCRRQ